jgi:hypothetical protein
VKSFKQFISEIFRPVKTYTTKDPKHPDLKIGSDSRMKYTHRFFDDLGEPILDKDITTDFVRVSDPHSPMMRERLEKEGIKIEPHNPNTWEATFTVGGLHSKYPTQNFPSDIAKKIFDHFAHFAQTTKELTGESPILHYETPHPKKHRIYQSAAKILGVKATNLQTLNPEYDERMTDK